MSTDVLSSATAGLLISCRAGEPPVVKNVLSESTLLPWHALSHVDDWNTQEGVDEATVAALMSEARLQRAVGLAVAALTLASERLASRIVDELERLLQVGVKGGDVLRELVVAPLLHSSNADGLAQLSLASGNAGVADLFDQLGNLQPLIRRFSELWLALPDTNLGEVVGSREWIWRQLVSSGTLLTLLESETYQGFRAQWNELTLTQPDQFSRAQAAQIGLMLAERLYPHGLVVRDSLDERFVDEHHGPRPRGPESDWYARKGRRDRALRQIAAIASAVAEGHDEKARHFLRDLINAQVADGDKQHAIKSLCNIAQRCADMFRLDFERECLEAALRLNPLDPWLQIQWGDHLKRLGQFDEAESTLTFAAKLAVGPNLVVAQSALADVARERGNFGGAEAIYRSIPGWNRLLSVRTALADLARITGNHDRALSEYRHILEDWPGETRAFVGIAEVLKRTGDLPEALRLYEDILKHRTFEDPDRAIYELAYSHLLMRALTPEPAFEIADSIVKRLPFLMQARVVRGSSLALLGRVQEALSVLPFASTPPGARGWVSAYARGVMLLRLRRYSEARNALVDSLAGLTVSRDDQNLISLAVAALELAEGNVGSAQTVLMQAGNILDSYARQLSELLHYHAAVAAQDQARAEEIVAVLRKGDQNALMGAAIRELEQGNFSAALRFEADLLLAAA